MGDEDELRLRLHPPQHLHETADVGLVEGRVDLVEQAERARLELEDREHQGHGGQRLLASRQKLNALQALAGRLGDDVDAALQQIGLVEQDEPRPAAAEQGGEGLLKMGVDGVERLAEPLARRPVDPGDGVDGGVDRLHQILPLRGQEVVALVEVVELLDGHHVHGPEALDLLPQARRGLLDVDRRLARAG